MNENRVIKYQRKIEIIKENMRDIALWSANLGLDELLSDKKQDMLYIRHTKKLLKLSWIP